MQTICGEPGCNAQIPAGSRSCSRHHKRQRKVYTSKRWVSHTRWFKGEHPLCQPCLEEGRTEATFACDHIIPHRGNPALFYDFGNMQPICRSCHSQKTGLEGGLSFEPMMGRLFLCGLPGTGKSYLARKLYEEHGTPIFDADEHEELQSADDVAQARSRFIRLNKTFVVIVMRTLTAMTLASRHHGSVKNLLVEEAIRQQRLAERAKSIPCCRHGIRLKYRPRCCEGMW